MSELVAYLIVLGAAATPWLEVLFVVPAGILAGLPTVPTIMVASIGNLATLVPVVLAGGHLRDRFLRRRQQQHTGELRGSGETSEHPQAAEGQGAELQGAESRGAVHRDSAHRDPPEGRGGRAKRLFQRFGVPGLAVLGPLLTGVHVAAAVAMAGGAERRRTLAWLSGGVVVWGVAAGVLTVLGVDVLFDRESLPDLGLD